MKKIFFIISTFLICTEVPKTMHFYAKVLDIKTIKKCCPQLKLHCTYSEYNPSKIQKILDILQDKNSIKNNQHAYFKTSPATYDILQSNHCIQVKKIYPNKL